MAEVGKIALVGGMATMPTRTHTLGPALRSILPQLTRLYLFLDGRRSVPAWARGHAKIVPLLPHDHGDLHGVGKFLPLRLEREPFVFFGFDDDILYPPNYAEVLLRAAARYGFKAMVGIHGAIFRPPHRSYARDRATLHFRHPLEQDGQVSQLGTGTVAFHSDTLAVAFETWEHRDMSDLLLAVEAMRQGIPRVAVTRPAGFLRALEEEQPDSIWRAWKADDGRHTRVMQDALQRYPEAAILMRQAQSGANGPPKPFPHPSERGDEGVAP